MSAAMLEPRPEMRMATRLRGMRQLTSIFDGGSQSARLMAESPRAQCRHKAARRLAMRLRRSIAISRPPGAPFEHSQSHYAGAYSLRSGHGVGDHDRVDARRVPPVPGRRGE